MKPLMSLARLAVSRSEIGPSIFRCHLPRRLIRRRSGGPGSEAADTASAPAIPESAQAHREQRPSTQTLPHLDHNHSMARISGQPQSQRRRLRDPDLARQINGIVNELSATPGRAHRSTTYDSDLRLYPTSHARQKRSDSTKEGELSSKLDSMREEMSTLRTDLDLLEWAKARVFVPTTAPDGTFRFPRTYPRILAHMMMVARENYSNPNLALSFFHYAQSHSVDSYFAGCLAAAYNELLRTRWESFADLGGVEQGVKEMEANGVAWNDKTSEIVNRVVEQVGKEVMRGGGRWGEDALGRISVLEVRVAKDLDDRQRAAVVRSSKRAADLQKSRGGQQDDMWDWR